MDKKIIYFTLFLILASNCCAYTILSYYGNDDDLAGIIFYNSTLTNYDSADLYFTGIEDMEEELLNPLLFVNEPAIITLKDNLDCHSSLLNKEEAEVEIYEDSLYCVQTKNNNIIQVEIIEISEDWTTLTIDWNIEEGKSISEPILEAEVLEIEVEENTEINITIWLLLISAIIIGCLFILLQIKFLKNEKN